MRIPFDPATDYYQLLGVTPGAPVEEIQAAYRRLAKEFHPDLNAGSTNAAERMARVNVAKSVLLDPETRATYDLTRAARRRFDGRAEASAAPAPTTVRYAPTSASVNAQRRPRYRVVSHGGAGRTAGLGGFDKQTGLLLVVALPLIAALVVYVFQAVQLSVQPLKAPPQDLSLLPAARPTARGAADAVFSMVHAQPPSRELATRANNLILSRSNSTPESELLRADGRRLVQSANAGDTAAWNAAVADVCELAGRC